MIRITVSPNQAHRLLESVGHLRFQQALISRWKVSDDWMVAGESLFWFFCWCKTGINSESARQEAIHIWDRMMPMRFTEANRLLNHEQARKLRYKKGVDVSFEP